MSADSELYVVDPADLDAFVDAVFDAQESFDNQPCCDGRTAAEHRHTSPDGRCCTDDPPSVEKPSVTKGFWSSIFKRKED